MRLRALPSAPSARHTLTRLKLGNFQASLSGEFSVDDDIFIRYFVAAVLVGLGIYCLVRHQHPRWVRMQVGFRDLAVWSFLMASAHGAGLMVVPVLLRGNTVEAQGRMAGNNHMSPAVSPLAGMLATAVHTVAYLAVTGLLAWLVYRNLGLALLRKVWFNFDLVWAAALVATGLVTLLI